MAVRSESDYRSQLRALMPPGPAWDPDIYPVPTMVSDAAAAELARVDARANALLTEMFPGTIRELLADWERVMGLPDACLGATAAPGERLTEVVRRFAEVGRQDVAYFEAVAARLGYPDARIEEWRTPRMGRSRFGAARFGDWGAQFVWTMHMGARLPGGARFGASRFGERFGANPNDIVECVVRRYAPAHTIVFFDYS
ncbi:YmfQ family protein [Castellaniella sp. UC4442_H9]